MWAVIWYVNVCLRSHIDGGSVEDKISNIVWQGVVRIIFMPKLKCLLFFYPVLFLNTYFLYRNIEFLIRLIKFNECLTTKADDSCNVACFVWFCLCRNLFMPVSRAWKWGGLFRRAWRRRDLGHQFVERYLTYTTNKTQEKEMKNMESLT